MRVWDRGRLAEFGIDLRGTWLHVKLNEWLHEDVPEPPRKKRKDMTPEDLAHWKRYLRMAQLSCFCEPCWREFLPWPFNWEA